jgi:hypothetical protein
MPQEPNSSTNYPPENYDVPTIVGDVDTIGEEVEVLEKKFKIPVWIWIFLIVAVSVVAIIITSNQSPTLNT